MITAVPYADVRELGLQIDNGLDLARYFPTPEPVEVSDDPVEALRQTVVQLTWGPQTLTVPLYDDLDKAWGGAASWVPMHSSDRDLVFAGLAEALTGHVRQTPHGEVLDRTLYRRWQENPRHLDVVYRWGLPIAEGERDRWLGYPRPTADGARPHEFVELVWRWMCNGNVEAARWMFRTLGWKLKNPEMPISIAPVFIGHDDDLRSFEFHRMMRLLLHNIADWAVAPKPFGLAAVSCNEDMMIHYGIDDPFVPSRQRLIAGIMSPTTPVTLRKATTHFAIPNVRLVTIGASVGTARRIQAHKAPFVPIFAGEWPDFDTTYQRLTSSYSELESMGEVLKMLLRLELPDGWHPANDPFVAEARRTAARRLR